MLLRYGLRRYSAGVAPLRAKLQSELKDIRDAGLYKNEWSITSPQGAHVSLEGRSDEVINFCANNYLGLGGNKRVVEAAKRAMDERGFGLASVRFICGKQDIHAQLERKIADFFGKEDCILYAACFDANGGLFEPLLGERDAVISDELNHASIIDGIRLTKCIRLRYKHLDMADLERQLQEADTRGAGLKMIMTDGVFSMDGDIAPLDKICDLADQYNAFVATDECHATGFIGKSGRGTPEHCGVLDRVDIITSTLGKALGGGSGGFTTGPKEVIDILRQRSRPYLFSNTLAPAIVGASLEVMQMLTESTEMRDRLERNTKVLRDGLSELGFELRGADHPIVPVMLYDAALAGKFADTLLREHGIYCVGFSYPVVPKGQARIRLQLSAAHSDDDIARVLRAFGVVGKQLGVLK